MTKEIFDACPNIKFVGVLATGYNVVDVNAAKEKGIPVCNIPTYGTSAVAQFVIALLMEMCHHVWAHSESVKNGDWEKCPDFCYWNYPLIELAGKTMGLIGFGRIGQATAKAAQGLGMNILAYDEFQIKELESDTLKYVVITSYSIHYTKLYEYPLSKQGKAESAIKLTRAASIIGTFVGVIALA